MSSGIRIPFQVYNCQQTNLTLQREMLGLEWLLFPTSPLPPCIRNTRLVKTRWLANSKRVVTYFPHNIWSSYEYLIHYQSEDSHGQ